jgi:hypothetical protein
VPHTWEAPSSLAAVLRPPTHRCLATRSAPSDANDKGVPVLAECGGLGQGPTRLVELVTALGEHEAHAPHVGLSCST